MPVGSFLGETNLLVDPGFTVVADTRNSGTIQATQEQFRIIDPGQGLPVTFPTQPAPVTVVGSGTNGTFFGREVADLTIVGQYLANPPKPTTPGPSVFQPPETNAENVFGSISLVDQYVIDATAGIRNLRTLFGDGDAGETEDSLTAQLETYLDDYMTGDQAVALFPGRAAELTIYFPQDSTIAAEAAAVPVFNRFQFDNDLLSRIENGITRDSTGAVTTAPATLHSNLFDAGRIVLDDTRSVGRLRHGLVRLRRRRERDLARRRQELAEVRSEIIAARQELTALNGVRQEALGDAQAAQALLAQDWAATEAAYETRRVTLEDNEGLAFVRVRETPVASDLADPLPLRADTGGGFPWSGRINGDLPDVLEPFRDAIHEIPVSDWQVLEPLTDKLPAPRRLAVLQARRFARLQSLMAAPALPNTSVFDQRLAPIHSLAQGVIAEFAGREIKPARSLREQQRAAALALALDDLATGGPGVLRGPALGLRDALEQALLGMLGLLRQIPGGVRLAWGAAAEEDTLAVRTPGRWPALDTVRDTEFNTLRSLFEVTEWWFDQLTPDASAASQTAMTAMIRATLMLAADDDPAEILQGTVRVAIPRLLPGAGLRLALNRRARPGAVLHLIDPSNAVVGLLRVDDEDEDGVSATVTETLVGTLPVDTRFTVVEQRLALWS